MGLDRDGYQQLLRRLQGSGYSTDADSVREGELGAVAEIAVHASEGLQAVERNLFLRTVDEALDAYERVRFFVASGVLSADERRARLVAFARGAHKAVSARLDAAFGGQGETLSPLWQALLDQQASPLGALLVGRRLPPASDSTEESERRDFDPILARGLPSRALSGGVSRRDLVWDPALELDSSSASIAVVPQTVVPQSSKARIAPLEAYPGMRVSRALWLELQAMLLWKGVGVTFDQLSGQGRMIVVSGSFAAAITDSTIDWTGRIVSIWGVASSTAGDDLTALPATAHAWLPSVQVSATPANAVRISDSTTAFTVALSGTSLQLSGSASLINVKLFVRATPRITNMTSGRVEPWMDTEHMVTAARFRELYRSTLLCDSGSDGLMGGLPAGALRRVVYTGGLRRPVADEADSSRSRVVLDSSENYLSRYVLVVPLVKTSTTSIPCASADGMPPRGTRGHAPRVFYASTGTAGSATAVLPYQHPDSLSSPSVWLYVDPDGALCAEMKTLSAAPAACLLALIIATDSESCTAVPVNGEGEPVQSIDLEQPQNTGCYAQGSQGLVPRYFLGSAVRSAPTAPPLGLVSEGPPPLRPVSWQVSERLGAAEDIGREVRQKLLGQRRRIVYVQVPAYGEVALDIFNDPTELAPGVSDQIDYRDRLIWIEAPGSSGYYGMAVLYTGPCTDIEVETGMLYLSARFVFSRAETGGYHSELRLKNTYGNTQSARLVIEISPQLGLTDLRQYGVVNAFQYASADEIEVDETKGYSDDGGETGGPYRDL